MNAFRLRKDRTSHLRMAEILRGLDAVEMAKPNSCEFMLGLAARGALDRDKHFEIYKGDLIPSWRGRQLLKLALSELRDRRLADRVEGTSRKSATYYITELGRSALREYDHPPTVVVVKDTYGDGPRPTANAGGYVTVGRRDAREVD